MLPPAPLGRPATVVRLARHVLDTQDLDAHGLEGTRGHISAGAVALDLDIHAPHALVHRLVGDALGRHLCREGCALAAPLEAKRSRRLPGYDVALLVAHGDDGVVEGALDVDHAGRYVAADPAPRPADPARALLLLPLPAHLPLLPPAYRRLRALALAGVRLGPLPAHWETPAVPYAPVSPDVYKPPDVLLRLAPQVALDLDVLVDVTPDLADLALRQVPNLRVGIDFGLAADLTRRRTPDAVDVGQPYLDALLARKVYSCYPRHANPASACAWGSYRSPAQPRGVLLPCTDRKWVSRSPLPSQLPP